MKNWISIAVLSASTLAITVRMTGVCAAQDMRRVSEPKYPPVCSVLASQIYAPDGIDPADETRLDTARLQHAIDNCGKDRAVQLSSMGRNNAFLISPLELRKGVTLLVDKGVTVYASRNPVDYEYKPGWCGVVNDAKKGCKPLINVKRGHDAGIMGEGAIDGRGGSKLLSNGVEQPVSWWDLAEQARKEGHQQVPRMVQTDHSDNFTLYKITLKNSPNVHVAFHHGNGMTVWGVKIDTPKNARNADGINPSSSKNVTITQSYIRSGDDNVAIKAGDGTTKNISITHNHFYWGHGMSIGSETNGGVKDIYVSDLTLDGPDNGIRIKSNPSRGGLVQEVLYDNVCVRKSKNPIVLETAYNIPGDTRTKEPVYRDIVLHNVRIAGGGKVQLLGLDATHRIGIQFDGVVVEDPAAKYKYAANHADITLGPGPVNFQMTGEDSTVRGSLGSGSAALAPCEARYVPFPGSSSVPASVPASTTGKPSGTVQASTK